jgi:hypothetical protein
MRVHGTGRSAGAFLIPRTPFRVKPLADGHAAGEVAISPAGR